MKKKFETVDEYIGSFPNDIQKILKSLRKTINDAVPGAEEVISYNIPAFKYKGWIFYIAAFTNHYTLACPPPFTVFKKFEKELSEFAIATSSIKFPYEKPVPLKLISAMAKFRATENTQAEAKKKKEKK
jgi:uncharacterized protein YdhG (YjbR/CyaY superfamily)